MKRVLLAALLAAGLAHADLVAKAGPDEIRLAPTACVHGETLGRIKPEYRERFKKAEGTIGGQRYYACWTEEQGQAFILFEDGDQLVLPLSMFKESMV